MQPLRTHCSTGAGTTCETVDFGALGRDRVRAAARDHALGLLLRDLLRI